MRFIALVLGFSLSMSTWAGPQTEQQCRNLYRLTDLAYAVEPGRVVAATESIPSHCKVRAVINRAIQVEVTMPVKDWNGRMMFSTVGGGAGSIGDITSRLCSFRLATGGLISSGGIIDSIGNPFQPLDGFHNSAKGQN